MYRLHTTGTSIPGIARTLGVDEKTIDRWLVQVNEMLVERLPADLDAAKADFIEQQRLVMNDAWKRLKAIDKRDAVKLVGDLQRNISRASELIFRALGGLSTKVELGAGKGLGDLLNSLSETPTQGESLDPPDLGDTSAFEG